MQWLEAIREPLAAAQITAINPALLHTMFGLIDLTSLNAEDTESSMLQLAKKTRTADNHVAAVCVGARFVRLLCTTLTETPINIATVVNFPDGNTPLAMVLYEIKAAISDGATEIDAVFPYTRYLAGDRDYATTFIKACKAACGTHILLKVILETGALQQLDHIADASECAILAGADFIKTSTGKIAEGASLAAAAVMLLVIRRLTLELSLQPGIKISGGVRTVAQAAEYMALAKHIMGPTWVRPRTFRIGASKLVDELLP